MKKPLYSLEIIFSGQNLAILCPLFKKKLKHGDSLKWGLDSVPKTSRPHSSKRDIIKWPLGLNLGPNPKP
jgi:hypothetical protein